MTLPTREAALALLESHVTTPYLRDHAIATEAALRRLAARFGADAELWGLTGLLHDLDLEHVGEDMQRHGRETVALLAASLPLPAEACQAILAHNGDVLGVPCQTPLDYALTAGESLTGLVFATALVLPSKDLRDVKPKSVLKRIKEPRFAAKISRERIGQYVGLGLPPDEFDTLVVEAMQAVPEWPSKR
jgi:predicted hydrolase (HD superfamily)